MNLVSSTVMHSYYRKSLSPVASKEESPVASGSSLRSSRVESSRAEFESTSPRERHRSVGPACGSASVHSTQKVNNGPPAGGPVAEFIDYSESDSVQGGQLTRDLVAVHNIYFSNNKVSLSDLNPSTEPEFECRGTVPLKNGVLICGCFVRAEAPDPASYRDIAGFDCMPRDSLRRLIFKLYAKSGFINCRIQPLRIMNTDQPLKLFVDPTVKPVAIHKAAIIPIHLKVRVKADLDSDVWLGILEKVDIN